MMLRYAVDWISGILIVEQLDLEELEVRRRVMRRISLKHLVSVANQSPQVEMELSQLLGA